MLLSAATLLLLSGALPDTARASGVAATTVDAPEPNEGAASLAPRSPLEGDSARRLGGKNNPKFGWRSDLPWGDLKEDLHDPATLKDVGPANFIEECAGYSEYENEPFFPFGTNRTNWDLIDTPSGVCTPDLFCGFGSCDPKPNPNNERFVDRYTDLSSYSVAYDTGAGPLPSILGLNDDGSFVLGPGGQIYSSLPPKYRNWIENEANPSYDISRKVLFPRKASDVVAAVKFAGKYGLQVSVKNSGHSYSRSSTKGDTLLLNMRQYMRDMIAITSCDEEEYDLGDDLSGQPCKLAKERNKPGVLQLMAANNWGEVYGAVNEYNRNKEDEDKFLITGGAAATVSPHGWIYQGGLSGTTGGRMNGFGADQVLQFEMVLANGKHVKFGPTEWDPVPDCNDCAPKTTKVEGKCNAKAGEDDEDWVACDEETNSFFPMLWKAMRGGAAGYGVVVSTHLQLHPYKPYVDIVLNFALTISRSCLPPGSTDPEPDWPFELLTEIQDAFLFQAFLDPTSVGLTEDEGDGCGSPGFTNGISCQGNETAVALTNAWKAYLAEDEVRALLEGEGGLDQRALDLLEICNTVDAFENGLLGGRSPVFADYATALLESSGVVRDGVTLPQDTPPPAFVADQYSPAPNVVVPADWILNNLDKAAKLFPRQYAAFGGTGQAKADDGMNAVSKAYRDGGNMYFFYRFKTPSNPNQVPPEETFAEVDTFWKDYFPEMFNLSDDDLAAKDEFPSVFGSNHYGFDRLGPRKDDWTKACPREWSRIRRDRDCISVQEAVWGTKLLRELEAIKDTVDPDGMFTCHRCVGDNKARKKNMPATSNKPSKNEPASLNSKVSFKDVPESEARNGAAAKGFAWLGAAMCVVWNGWALQW